MKSGSLRKDFEIESCFQSLRDKIVTQFTIKCNIACSSFLQQRGSLSSFPVLCAEGQKQGLYY